MPARADHEQRRRDVARTAAALIATGGLAAATHRRIAEASGCSTTVVSHYFTDKRDLVKATYTEVGDRVSPPAWLPPPTPPTRLPSILEALLPARRGPHPRLAAPVHLPRPGRHRHRTDRRAALPRHHGARIRIEQAIARRTGRRVSCARTSTPKPAGRLLARRGPRHRDAGPLRPDRRRRKIHIRLAALHRALAVTLRPLAIPPARKRTADDPGCAAIGARRTRF